MITKINNPKDMQEALNENLEGLITGKRKPIIAKEVTNVCGKMLANQAQVLMYKSLIGDKMPINWFEDANDWKKLEDKVKKQLDNS
jgi:hypothetical protein